MAQPVMGAPQAVLPGDADRDRASDLSRRAIGDFREGRLAEAAALYADALLLYRKALGDRHPDTLTCMNNYARVLEALDRPAEAEPLFAETLRLRREVLGDMHPQTLSSLNSHADVLETLGRAKEAEALYAEALRIRREVFGNTHADTLTTLTNNANVLTSLGRIGEAERLYAEALQLQRTTLGEDHPDTLESLSSYAQTLHTAGRVAEAEPFFAQAYALRRSSLGESHPDTLASLRSHAFGLQQLSRAQEAEPLFAEAYRLTREKFGESHPDTLIALSNIAGLLDTAGRADDAEPLYAEVLRLRRQTQGEHHPETLRAMNNHAFALSKLGRNGDAEPLLAETLTLRRTVLGENHPDTLISLNNYASLLQELGRANEVEPLLAEALRGFRSSLGDMHPQTLTSLSNYAGVLYELGRYADALPIFAEVLKNRSETLGENHPDTLISKSNLAGLLDSLGRPEEAEPLYAEVLQRRRNLLGEKHPDTLTSLNNYAAVLGILGRAEEAEALYAQALVFRRDVQGETHPDTRTSLNNLAVARIEWPAASHLAIDPARSLIASTRAAREVAGFSPGQKAQRGREEKSESEQFRMFVETAWLRGPGLRSEALTAGATSLDASGQAALREEVFTALQDALAGAAGKAISAKVAQKAAGPFEPLAIERELLSEEWIRTDSALVEALADNGAQNEIRRRDLRAQLAVMEARMRAIDDTLRSQAPEYFALIRPSALSLAQAQALLAPDEAALIVVPTGLGTHVMLVTDEGLTWARSDWTKDIIDAAVRRLLWDVGGNVDVDSVDVADWENEGAGAYPFAFGVAQALYAQLIAPVADGLKGKRHLFVSASGSLSSLPFGLLVSEVPAGDSGDPEVLRSAKWFADAHALVQIPSLQSLEFLRKYRTRRGDAASLPFLGVGDPVLDGQAETRGGRGARTTRASGNGAFSQVFAGSQTRSGEGIANISGLKTMARLPGTASELTAMWEQFGKPANALHLADRATEDFVRTPGTLSASIIAFATHGLLAGEIGGTAEPGLVLTPPSQGSEANDGYLSTSEIAALKLNADWVILSACNTAAGDGSEGAPGLSGLARSFFYAGARNLLASHWPVRDDVAAKLTVRTIAIAKESPGLSRAEAFQLAMREVREDRSADSETDTWSHPSAWAPFSLIGDGAN